MLPIRTQGGKPFIGDLEVTLSPVFLGLECGAVYEQGKPLPPFDVFLAMAVSNTFNQGVDLFGANAYRLLSMNDSVKSPEINVPDGKVPAQIDRRCVIDFYVAHPVAVCGKYSKTD